MSEIRNKAFLTYYDNEIMYKLLSNEDAGKLIKAMFRYCKDGEEILAEADGMAYGYFEVLKSQFERDDQKYVQQALKKKARDAERYQKKKEAARAGRQTVTDDGNQYGDIDNSDEPF